MCVFGVLMGMKNAQGDSETFQESSRESQMASQAFNEV